MRKKIGLLLALVMVCGLVLGVAGNNTPARAQDGPQYAGLDKDLSGVTIRFAGIGGQPYESMYQSIDVFEAETGATVEIVFLGDGF